MSNEVVLEQILEIDKVFKESYDFIPLDERVTRAPKGFSLVKDYPAEYPRFDLSKPDPALATRDFYKTVRYRYSARRLDPEQGLLESELSTLLYLTAGRRKGAQAYGVSNFHLFMSPSSGGLHGQDIYLVQTRPMDGLLPGVFYYDKVEHQLVRLGKACHFPSAAIAGVSYRQWFLLDAPVILIFVANLKRGCWKYGLRYYKFSLVDVGVAAAHAHLAATAMGLGSCLVAGFDAKAVASHLALASHELPVLMMTLGRERKSYG